jgi:hypothetical protein
MKKNYNFEQNIREALEKFKIGYRNRDIKVIDEYIETLFEKNEKTAVLGTSFGEWKKGTEGAKELVQSDWEYWGDVEINTASANISIVEDVAFIDLKGTVRYEFEYTDEKVENYLNYVKRFFDPANDQYKMNEKAKAGAIGFVLTHFNQNREAGKRAYFYPMRINAVMTMQEDRAVFRFMKFSIDYFGKYPELRIDNQMMNMNEYYQQQNDFIEEFTKEQRPQVKDAIEEFKKLIDEGFNSTCTKADIEKHLCTQHNSYVIDTAGHKEEAAAFVEAQRNIWQKLAVDYNAVFADAKGNTAWLVCNGLASCTMDREKGAKQLMADIQKIVEGSFNSKDKLFIAQREVANYFLQYSKGEYFLWPVRITAMMVMEENQWRIHNMSFSYPFYYILEGKYSGADML